MKVSSANLTPKSQQPLSKDMAMRKGGGRGMSLLLVRLTYNLSNKLTHVGGGHVLGDFGSHFLCTPLREVTMKILKNHVR